MGQKKATMTDVAKLSGVSQSTVSLVLNQKSRGAIPPETVSKVLSAAQALHYTKPPRARSQARSEQSVLVLASDPTNPYYSFLLHELDLAAAPHDLLQHLPQCPAGSGLPGDRAEFQLPGRHLPLSAGCPRLCKPGQLPDAGDRHLR